MKLKTKRSYLIMLQSYLRIEKLKIERKKGKASLIRNKSGIKL